MQHDSSHALALTPHAESEGHGPRTARTDPAPRAPIGWIVLGSLAVGLIAAGLLVVAPFVAVEESALTGAVLGGFAIGWAMLAALSARFTDQPRRWAAVPAAVMGLAGALLMAFGPSVRPALDWVWPAVALALAVWMAIGAHRVLRSRSRRWLLHPVITVLALAAIGGGYATAREATGADAYPMPGQLIDVGGHRLHLSCTGSGSPTVVLEPGAGAMSSHLGWITPAVARQTRVCVYDRAGRGWSEAPDTPQDAVQVATDLHTLLQRGSVPGPYVLAGHSFGGLYALTFAARHPDDVAGMVLIDSTTPGSMASAADQGFTDSVMSRVAVLLSASARLGVGPLLGKLAAADLPPESANLIRARSASAGSLRSTIEEYLRGSTSAETPADVGDKPLIVLTAGRGHDAAWTTAQKRLAGLSTNSAHRVIAGATHGGMVADKQHAAATAQAIVDVVTSVRHPGPLGG